MAKDIWTIGHSTRTIEQFVNLLKAHGIVKIADVRTIPRSRHNPQFNGDKLKRVLKKEGIGYMHLQELGGLRRAKKDSENTIWRNASFRGYADYMGTKEFEAGIIKLMKLAAEKRTAIMCAEAVPWRCHRSLLADALTKKKWRVFHIMSGKTANRHKLSPFLRTRKGRLIYPAEEV